ncbi:hypothetical protein O3P69_020588 [Scylla paramamosain]|uniref:Uncharacterized protein n=1 Tax=Scylla paramamosain TaxID=85552 RepID=A0AAW0TMF4_SCYPA
MNVDASLTNKALVMTVKDERKQKHDGSQTQGRVGRGATNRSAGHSLTAEDRRHRGRRYKGWKLEKTHTWHQLLTLQWQKQQFSRRLCGVACIFKAERMLLVLYTLQGRGRVGWEFSLRMVETMLFGITDALRDTLHRWKYVDSTFTAAVHNDHPN